VRLIADTPQAGSARLSFDRIEARDQKIGMRPAAFAPVGQLGIRFLNARSLPNLLILRLLSFRPEAQNSPQSTQIASGFNGLKADFVIEMLLSINTTVTFAVL
jgi:hypothetical protein